MGPVFRGRWPHRGPGRLPALKRAVLRLHAVLLALMAAFVVAPLASGENPWHQVAARLVIVVVFGVVAVDLQIRGERPEHLLATLGLVLLSPVLRIDPPAADLAAGFVLAAFCLSAARLLTGWYYLAAVVLVGGLSVLLRWAVGDSVMVALDDAVVSAGLNWAAAGVFVEALRRSAYRAQAAADRADARRAERQDAEAERLAVREASRALHDDVLAALRLVADGHCDRDLVRRTCGRARDSVAAVISPHPVREAPVVSDLADLLGRITAAAPVEVEVDIGPGVSDVDLPSAATEAIEQAVAEALRNAGRHSGSVSTWLRVRVSGVDLVVDVADDGVGWCGPARPGHGMTHSIVAPVESAGGRVSFEATPGGGATVRLHMPIVHQQRIPPERMAYDATMHGIGGRTWVVPMAWPLAAAWGYASVRGALGWPDHLVSFTLLAGYVAVSACVIAQVARAAATRRWIVSMGAALVALEAVSLSLLPDGAMLDYRSWPQALVALPLLYLAIVLPARWAVAMIAPHPLLVLLAWWWNPALSEGAVPWGSLNAVVLVPFFGVLVGGLMRRTDRHAREADAESSRLAMELAVSDAVARVASLHLDHTRRTVIPWLSAVALGTLDLSDPAVRARAEGFAAEVRDDLYAPGFFDDRLRAGATAFRSRGGQLRLRPGLAAGGWSRRVGRILDVLLRDLDGQHIVTVIPPRRPDDVVRVSVVPPAPWVALSAEAHGLDIAGDRGRTVVAVPDLSAAS